MTPTSIDAAITKLQDSYLEYMAALKNVLDMGEATIEPLAAALNHRHANPIAKALGLMMAKPGAEKAIPQLLHWLVTQSPLYPDVLDALIRAGDKPANLVLIQIREYAKKGDDEAVRHLFDLACRFSIKVQPQVADIATELLEYSNPHIRETAADAIGKIGLPYGLQGKALLQFLRQNDPIEHVKEAAAEALEKLGN